MAGNGKSKGQGGSSTLGTKTGKMANGIRGICSRPIRISKQEGKTKMVDISKASMLKIGSELMRWANCQDVEFTEQNGLVSMTVILDEGEMTFVQPFTLGSVTKALRDKFEG
jgi:hypothetical protein